MRRNGNGCFLSDLQMAVKSIYTGDVIRVNMSEDDLAHRSSFRDQIIDAVSQSLPFILIRRPGIDHQNFTRGVNQVTIGVRGGRLCRRAYGKANVIGMKLDSPGWLATRLRHR